MVDYTTAQWEKSALVTIDTQCDTLEGQPFAVAGTDEILPLIRQLLEAFRKSRRPIVHVVRLYPEDGHDVDLCRKALVESGKRLFRPGTSGCQLAPALRPEPGTRLDENLLLAGKLQAIAPNEVVIYKPRWGAFYRTGLEQHLRRQDVSTLIFCGCNFLNCPRASIYQASERDFRVVVAKDAVSGIYRRAETELEAIGIALMTTARIVETIGRYSRERS